MASAVANIGLSLDEIIKQQRGKRGGMAGRGRGASRGARGGAVAAKRTPKVSALLNVDREILQQAGITTRKLQLVKKLINRARGFKTVPSTRGVTAVGPKNRRGGGSLRVGVRSGIVTRGRGTIRGRTAGRSTAGPNVKLQLRTPKKQINAGPSGRGLGQRLGWQRAKRDEMLGQKRGLTVAQNKRVQVGAMRCDIVVAEQKTQARQNLLRRGLSTRRGRTANVRGALRSAIPTNPVRGPWRREGPAVSSTVFSRIGNVPRQRGRSAQATPPIRNVGRQFNTQLANKGRVGVRGNFSSNSTRLTLNERFGQGSAPGGRGGRQNRSGRQVMY